MNRVAGDRAAAAPLRRVRATVLCSGIAILRARGLFDAYCAGLDPDARERILGIIAGEWVSLPLAMAHFQACENLHLSAREAFAIGEESGIRTQSVVLRTLLRVGATPRTVLGQYDRLSGRLFDGGGFAVSNAGPKDAVLEITEFPPARFSYFRNAARGLHSSAMRLFASTVYVSELPGRTTQTGFSLRIAWA